MLIIPIMLYISWLVGNHLWAYIAFGLSVFGSLLTAAKKQSQQSQLNDIANKTVDDFLKSLKSKLN